MFLENSGPHLSKWRILYLLTLASLLFGCDKEDPAPFAGLTEEEVIQIPVVVHVIYAEDAFNVSDQKIASQLKVLNEDFRKRNPDHAKTPEEFKHLVADVGIEFVLATQDPEGKPTNGITRTYSTISGFDGHGEHKPIDDRTLFFTSKGGHDAWPTDRYLNIWVVEMSDRHGNLGLAGYAHMPGADPRIDGVVIDPRTYGTLPPLTKENALGRTATHEIGHWLNLHHLNGQTPNGCNSTDLVDDTPPASDAYWGTPSYPQYSCGQSSLFMNFMDRVDDEAMYMFTKGQRARMRAVFAPDGKRHQLYLNSKKQ
ncbi:zinc metalloprotease [Sabulibacter ruber]|uniref:zinc metalloprotease n=1 Tax=Sabulibacter ruber TaxID=2811901 RepID=UPI001A97807D|nr:zinc metalloprotease [Sabulibacter ruber]